MSKSQKKSTAKSSHESKQNVKEEQDLAKNEDQEESLDKLKEKIAELEAAVLYAKAETENFRKRSIDEMDKARKYAIENFATEILLVKDSLDAALMVDESSIENYKEGIELTSKQLISVFEKLNIKEVDPKGDVFDPNFHEAMTMVESDQDANTVISVMQKGYTLNERVLRPALVTVAKEKS
ncbi:MAG: nucleotide exchange factor GrpE [Nitrosomonadales bacterium]|jgi:molecular chaperone GrpE|nr:nucleotide exchange factor GrpE [Nitrosomonadales bacterium]